MWVLESHGVFLGGQSGGFVPLLGCFWFDNVCVPERKNKCDFKKNFLQNKHVSSKSFNFFKEETKEAPMTEGEEDDSDDDVEPIAEFRFVPSDKSACKCEWELCFTLKSWLYVEDTWV